jgi:uncharacterized membrane protein
MLRGLAMVWMTIFHFCFDLQYFGYLHTDFHTDPFWTLQRSAIVSLFVFCAGLGQAIALQQGQDWRRFGKRWRQIAGAALLVSAGSYLMFPTSFIYFGILHGMAAMLILARGSAVWRRWLWPLGALALSTPWLAAALHLHWAGAEALNTSTWNWIGLISRKPITEDYAPLLPWIGVMFWGVASGQWLLQHHPQALARWSNACTKSCSAKATEKLAWMGRHSLAYYLLHQPLLLGALTVISLASPAATLPPW